MSKQYIPLYFTVVNGNPIKIKLLAPIRNAKSIVLLGYAISGSDPAEFLYYLKFEGLNQHYGWTNSNAVANRIPVLLYQWATLPQPFTWQWLPVPLTISNKDIPSEIYEFEFSAVDHLGVYNTFNPSATFILGVEL